MKRFFLTALVIFLTAWGVAGCSGGDKYHPSIDLKFHNFDITYDDAVQDRPAVAYSEDEELYLVVWQEGLDENADVKGILLDEYVGDPVGSAFSISEELLTVVHDADYTVPAYSPYTVTLLNFHSTGEIKTGTVSVTDNTTSYTETSSPSASGEFSVNYETGVFTFHHNDAGKTLHIACTEEYTGVSEQANPSVAYNARDRRFLVVWQDERSGEFQIYGQLVDAMDGTLIGENFAIDDSAGNHYNPRVVFNTEQREFFVVYETGDGDSKDIEANIIDHDGYVDTSAVITIESNAGRQEFPAVAYNSINDEYLVVWSDFRNDESESDLYAVICDEDGAPGADFSICTQAEDQTHPDVAYASAATRNQYLVVWEDYADGEAEIKSRIVLDDGSLDSFSGEVNVTNSGWEQVTPTVGYEPRVDYFVVAWRDNYRETYDIFGQVVRGDGSLFESYTILSNTEWDADERCPAVALNSHEHEFMFVFSTNYHGEWGIAGQIGD